MPQHPAVPATTAVLAGAFVIALCYALPRPISAQETVERTPQLSGGWVAVPGSLEVHLRQLLHRPGAGAGIASTSDFSMGLGVSARLMAGVDVTLQSTTIPGSNEEWQLVGRLLALGAARPHALQGAVTGAYNGTAGSFDAEASLSQWLGPARLMGALRAFTDGYDEGDARVAAGAGVVLHPLPGRAPVALAGDLVSLFDRRSDERLAWSAGLQVGVLHTPHTLSLFAANSTSGTLQGRTRGTARTRYGIELTLHVPIGRAFGWYPERAEAARAVREAGAAEPVLVSAEISRYMFEPRRIEIPAGATVEWTNRDDVVHTVSADDGTWDSRGMETGTRWRATFDRPGRYTYHCGPHPYMRGIVIVR